MSDADVRGPQVDAAENLYRAIHVPDWWILNVDPPRVKSFAFKVSSPFSVNISSVIGREGAIRHLEDVLHQREGGIVVFNCGEARSHGFDARLERDPQHPDNEAHANVYFDGTKSGCKRAAKKLAECCKIVRLPTF